MSIFYEAAIMLNNRKWRIKCFPSVKRLRDGNREPFCSGRIAIAVEETDYEKMKDLLKGLPPAKEFRDGSCHILYWKEIFWKGESVGKITEFLKERKHSLVRIDEDGSVYEEQKTEDRNGYDEKFESLLRLSTEPLFFDSRSTYEKFYA